MDYQGAKKAKEIYMSKQKIQKAQIYSELEEKLQSVINKRRMID